MDITNLVFLVRTNGCEIQILPSSVVIIALFLFVNAALRLTCHTAGDDENK